MYQITSDSLKLKRATALKGGIMKVTIEIQDELYKEIETLAGQENSSIDKEVEKAILLLTKKKMLVKQLMKETCNEFDDAMRKLAN